MAALGNGVLAYYADMEAYHIESVMHPLAVAVPAAFAAGELMDVSGEDFLCAVVVGVDFACRVSAALDPRALYARGFHPTAVAGAFGAVAAAGRLLGLREDQWHHALGLTALQAGGLISWVTDYSELSRPLNSGLAARAGVTAAELASLGYAGPRGVLDRERDVFAAFSGVRRPAALLDRLGSHFLISELTIKRYASCAFLHPGLDALLSLMGEYSLTIHDLEAIDLHFPASGAHIIDGNDLKSHNAQYILSVAALRREVTLDDILQDKSADPEVMRLSRHVRVIHAQDLDSRYPASYISRVVLYARDGRTYERTVEWARGTRQNPVDRSEVERKYFSMANQRCAQDQAREIAARVLTVEEAGIRTLTESLLVYGEIPT
jgi:2-methylcitrate dehydratase PrpD